MAESGLLLKQGNNERTTNMVVDNEDFERIEKKLRAANGELQTLVGPMALAKTVIEISGNQFKMALATQQRRYIERGEGSANSEAYARADPLYKEEFNKLRKQLEDAYQVAYRWEALKEIIGSARSVLARMRESMNL